MSCLPRYRRVRTITVKSRGKLKFLWCDCGFYDRIGIPCSHIFRVLGQMTLNMFHIRHWRYYEAYYNDQSKIGQHLVQAQKEHFDNEGMGVLLLSEQIELLHVNSANNVFFCIEENIQRAENTTTFDWTDAKFVLEKCSQGSCLWSDLDEFVSKGRKPEFITPRVIIPFEGYRKSQGFKSNEAQRLQTNVFRHSQNESDDKSEQSDLASLDINGTMGDDSHSNLSSVGLCGTESRDEVRKCLITYVDDFLGSPRVSTEMVHMFHTEVKTIYKRMMSDVKEKGVAGENGEYEFACDEGIYKSPQKRKRNALDY